MGRKILHRPIKNKIIPDVTLKISFVHRQMRSSFLPPLIRGRAGEQRRLSFQMSRREQYHICCHQLVCHACCLQHCLAHAMRAPSIFIFPSLALFARAKFTATSCDSLLRCKAANYSRLWIAEARGRSYVFALQRPLAIITICSIKKK
jgi:hypothetical protein